MAATPGAEWDRLKWRRRNYARRQTRAQPGDGRRVLMAAEPLTELEAAIETVVTTFFTFAGQGGRKGSLSIDEFRELATQQLPHLLKDVGSLDEKMKSLDVNQDSELKFHEYWRLIGLLAKEIRKERALEIQKK
ncbi:protein S100-A13 isoform X1 [Callorhinus ursinus]|uniref:protein S100-A13 isoform X1 n=1 Tax=Callorhinus ursinus TaxID=34884 RepID=UPI003CD00CC8